MHAIVQTLNPETYLRTSNITVGRLRGICQLAHQVRTLSSASPARELTCTVGSTVLVSREGEYTYVAPLALHCTVVQVGLLMIALRFMQGGKKEQTKIRTESSCVQRSI